LPPMNANQRKSVEIGPLSATLPDPLTFICGKKSGSLAFGVGSAFFLLRRIALSRHTLCSLFRLQARTSRWNWLASHQAKRRRFSSWPHCRCLPLRSAFRLLGRSLTWPSIPNRAGPDRFPPHLRLRNTICLSALWGGTSAGPRHARARLASPGLLPAPSLHPRQGAACAMPYLRQDYPH